MFTFMGNAKENRSHAGLSGGRDAPRVTSLRNSIGATVIHAALIFKSIGGRTICAPTVQLLTVTDHKSRFLFIRSSAMASAAR